MVTEFMDDGQLGEWGVRPIVTVHDSILFLIPDDAPQDAVVSYITDRMENPPTKRVFGVEIGVPLQVDHKIGPNWGDAE
jgi:DNA polymerase I-like protein with 3'-5' exonuclease and polymerase domains